MSHTDHTPATPEQSEHHSAVFQHSAYSGIRDKVVVVTGSGIGLALAEGFARNGAHLLLIDINDQSMTDAKITLQHRFPTTRVECFQASVTDEAAVEAAFAHAKACFGRIDVLLNNAGVSINKPSLDITPAEWRRAIEINFNSVFFCAQAAARYMIDQQAGVIINTSSMWGVSHSADRTAYCATKAAVVSMTKCLAVEWARHGIRMNALVIPARRWWMNCSGPDAWTSRLCASVHRCNASANLARWQNWRFSSHPAAQPSSPGRFTCRTAVGPPMVSNLPFVLPVRRSLSI